MISTKEISVTVLICLGLTLFSFCLHVLPSTNTMVNYVDANHPKNDKLIVTDGFLPWAVDYHHYLLENKKRPVTVFLIEKLAQVLNLRISLSYVFVNFFLLFLGGLLVYYLAILYQLRHKIANLSVVAYFLSFSILLAYFIPIATVDEPAQYVFILSSFIALANQRFLMFIISFILAIITRETSFLLLPVMLLFFMGIDFKNVFKEKLKIIRTGAIGLFFVLFYIGYLSWFYKMHPELIDESKVWISEKFLNYKTKNFLDFDHSIQTLMSIISVNLLPIFLIIYYRIKHQVSPLESKLFSAFWITFSINFVLVILSAYVEESRVLTLPYLILFPIFGKILNKVIRFNKAFFKYFFNWKNILLLLAVTTLSWKLFKLGSKLTNYKPHENLNLFVEYNTLAILFIVLVLLYNRFSVKTKLPQQDNS